MQQIYAAKPLVSLIVDAVGFNTLLAVKHMAFQKASLNSQSSLFKIATQPLQGSCRPPAPVGSKPAQLPASESELLAFGKPTRPYVINASKLCFLRN